jgi:putative PIN family toxin of toxin-antitoxin system
MKVVLDTNVFVSGAFFSGPPFQILAAWREGRFQLVISPEILEEYRRVGEILAEDHPGVRFEPILEFVVQNTLLVSAPPLPEGICDDPDDDKFLACALASGSVIVVSGDRHLLKVSGYQNIEVLNPREFLEKRLF